MLTKGKIGEASN